MNGLFVKGRMEKKKHPRHFTSEQVQDLLRIAWALGVLHGKHNGCLTDIDPVLEEMIKDCG